MANLKQKLAEPITTNELRVMAEQLDAFLTTIRKAEAEAIKNDDVLFTYGIASGKAGIDRLRTLMQQLEVSRYRAALGQPVQANERLNKRS